MFSTLPSDERWKIVDLFKKHKPNALIDTILKGHLAGITVDDPEVTLPESCAIEKWNSMAK